MVVENTIDNKIQFAPISVDPEELKNHQKKVFILFISLFLSLLHILSLVSYKKR
jgi:hypothetical protein